MLLKAVLFKEAQVNRDERTFEGYAATFGNVDRHGEVIDKGAFAESLEKAADRVKVLWQHSEPLGMPLAMREDRKGLYVKAKVSRTRLGDEALELMKDGVVDRMSIGYRVLEYGTPGKGDNSVHLAKLELLEFSPVTFPANDAAVITGVKEFARLDPRLMERILREAGLSKNEAQVLMAKGFAGLREAAANQEGDAPIVTPREAEGDEDAVKLLRAISASGKSLVAVPDLMELRHVRIGNGGQGA